jgi:hypothetical protein
MNKLKQNNYLVGILLVSLFSLSFYGCRDDDTELTRDPSTSIEFATLNTVEDLSDFDLEQFIIQNDNIEIVLNKDTRLKFSELNHPVYDDPEADVVYTTKDQRGSITFGVNGTMYFMYDDLEENPESNANETPWIRSYWGRLNNNASEIIKKKERANQPRNDEGTAYTILNTPGKNVFVEYRRLQVTEEKPNSKSADNHTSCNVIPTENSQVNDKRNTKLNKASKVIKVKVYTYNKALSNDDINKAKIITRNSLTYGFNTSVTRIYTYFNMSQNGNRIASFTANNSSGSDLLTKWGTFRLNKGIYGYYDLTYKYLLLTDFSTGDLNGLADNKQRSAWAKVSGKDHYTPAHEVGHMFSAVHTSSFWKPTWWIFGWWHGDVMYAGNHWGALKHSPRHQSTNRNRIKAYVNKIIN